MAEASGSPTAGEAERQSTMAGCRSAHERLFETLEDLDEVAARRASRLPGWTVAHVLTHLARNAESHVRMLAGAGRGEALEQYEGGHEQRAADIEAGSGRLVAVLVDDVRSTALQLEEAWDRMPSGAWDGHGLAREHVWPCRDMPFHRWREVEIHHVDLGLAYGIEDWPEEYVGHELPLALASLHHRLPDPAVRRRLLAWLLDRADQPGGTALDPWQSRPQDYFSTDR